MKRPIKILLCTVSVAMINAGFTMPVILCFWILTGYEVVSLIPRWVGPEFYILLFIPAGSVLLLLSQILIPAQKMLVFVLPGLLDFSFAFSIYEILRTSFYHPNDALTPLILSGYYLMSAGIILLNGILLIKGKHS